MRFNRRDFIFEIRVIMAGLTYSKEQTYFKGK